MNRHCVWVTWGPNLIIPWIQTYPSQVLTLETQKSPQKTRPCCFFKVHVQTVDFLFNLHALNIELYWNHLNVPSIPQKRWVCPTISGFTPQNPIVDHHAFHFFPCWHGKLYGVPPHFQMPIPQWEDDSSCRRSSMCYRRCMRSKTKWPFGWQIFRWPWGEFGGFFARILWENHKKTIGKWRFTLW